MTAWTRSRSSSLNSTELTCDFTVWLARQSRAAISALVRPPATSSSTSCSRGVSRPSAGDGTGRECVANSAMSLRVTPGASRASPPRMIRTACRISSGVASLSRKPLAPARSALNVVVQVERGQHEHPRRELGLGQHPRRLDPSEHRHPDVHEHHVGPELRGEPDSLLPVPGRADHRHVVLGLEQGGEAHPHDGLVVDDQQPQRPVAGHGGSSPRPPGTVVPADTVPAGPVPARPVPARPVPAHTLRSSPVTLNPPRPSGPAWNSPRSVSTRSRRPVSPYPAGWPVPPGPDGGPPRQFLTRTLTAFDW